MNVEITESNVSMVVSFEELCRWEQLGLGVYATPGQDLWRAEQIYIGSRPAWRDDFLLATVDDFLEAEGLDSLGWQEMTEAEFEHAASETMQLIVSRQKRVWQSHRQTARSLCRSSRASGLTW